MFPDHNTLALIHDLTIRVTQGVLAHLDGCVAMLLYLYDVELDVFDTHVYGPLPKRLNIGFTLDEVETFR